MSPNPGFLLVAPASRGIGFALTRQLLTRTDLPIVATSRENVDNVRDQLLDGLDGRSKSARERLKVFEMDVRGR
jgi:NAD(P)-dependent dehydrogenase (short-subunit alcohol dehydrogenase family)